MILVTGASGFIGKHLLKYLVITYGKDKILALTSKPIATCAYLIHNDYTFDENYFINNGYYNIHTIVHAGAFTPKNSAEANNQVQSNLNVSNTEKLLHSIHPKLKKVIFLSTLDVYKDDEVIHENTKLQPISLYAKSKLTGEEIVGNWSKNRNISHQILRVGHVYGPGEEAYQKIIPLTIKKLLKNEHIEIWGTGNEIRSFIYIDDVVKAIGKAITLGENIGPINIVSGNQVTINNLIKKLIEISGSNSIPKLVATTAISRNLIFDNQKMKQVLLYRETPLNKGLSIEYNYMKKLNDENFL